MNIKKIRTFGLALLCGAVVFASSKTGMAKEVPINTDLSKTTTSGISLSEDNNIEEIMEEDLSYEVSPACISTTGLNVRSDASTDSEILGTVTPGFKFEKLGDYGDWDKILYYGREAYVHNDYTNDTYMVKGTPISVLYSSSEVNFIDKETNKNKILNPYVVMFVYGSDQDRLLVYADGRLGYVENREYNTLDGTYTIVDLSDQRIDLYKDNELLYSSPVVTGKDGMETSIGCYPVWYEKHNDYLKGPGYSVYVRNFYAFCGGQGLHDADWRSSFGSEEYHSGGSHGCVNLPKETGDIISEYFEEAQKREEKPKVFVMS